MKETSHHDSFSKAASLLGDNWTMRILYCFYFNPKLRFSDLEEKIPEICSQTLSTRLHDLENAKIICKIAPDNIFPKGRYELTALGCHTSIVIKAIHDFGKIVK